MSYWIKAKVVFGNKQSFDISDRIESLRYVSATEKDNSCEFKIRKEYVINLLEDDRIIIGNFIVFSWGKAGGKSSPVITMKISNVEPSYAEKVTLTILSTDMGNTAKKITSNEVVTVKTIAEFKTIVLEAKAKSMGLKLVVNDNELNSIDLTTVGSQAHMSTLDWLKKIANRNGFMCYVDNKNMFFKKRDLRKKPYRTFVYNDGDGQLISFHPKLRETTELSSAGEVQTVSVDPMTGETKSATSADEKDSLGKFLNKYSSDAKFAGTEGDTAVLEDKNYNGARKTLPVPDANGNQAQANKLNQDAQLDQHTATVKTIGDPNWFADTIVTISNVDKRNAGNWYVKSVTHTISGNSAYTCDADLSKYGSNAATKAGAANAKGSVNNETGPKDGNAKKQVPEYNANAQVTK